VSRDGRSDGVLDGTWDGIGVTGTAVSPNLVGTEVGSNVGALEGVPVG
jgi:hypothetical protein